MGVYDFYYYFENDLSPTGSPMWKEVDLDEDPFVIKKFLDQITNKFITKDELINFLGIIGTNFLSLSSVLERIISQMIQPHRTRVFITYD